MALSTSYEEPDAGADFNFALSVDPA